jgi:ectoine hydroxylase-related dioxygenase (phytanoyl-CoA dioxygenase family)
MRRLPGTGESARSLAMQIDDATVEAYRQDGAVALRRVFAPEWIRLLAEGVEENLSKPGPYAKRYTPEGKPGLFFGDYCNWRRISAYERFFRESPAAAIAARLMGATKVNLFHEHVLVKEPGTLEPTPWHHDQPYYFVDGAQIVSLWIPLDPVPRQTCVEYVAGSHRWGKWYTPKRFVDSAEHPDATGDEAVPDIDSNREKYRLLAWDLEPGDCIAFHALTLHGAPGNPLSTRRRAFAARFTGNDARYVLRDGFMSPPPQPDAPPPGGPMDSSAFPVIWRA